MSKLLASLRASDESILPVIARFWGVDISRLSQNEIPDALDNAMRDEATAARVWDKLDDAQRGTLQTLISAKNQMMESMFSRLHGEIRRMGRAQIEREDPLNQPQSVAEALYYRGLIYTRYGQSQAGSHLLVYVPADLADALPTHKTVYEGLEAAPAPSAVMDRAAARVAAIHADELPAEHVTQADTTIVDDMTTLLAHLQVFGAAIREGELSPEDGEALAPHLMHADRARLRFLFLVGLSAELIDVQEGRARPHRATVKRWLEAPRAAQLKALVDAWATGTRYRELWHVEGLRPEQTDQYNPVAGRSALVGFLRDFTPQGEWWSIDEFITLVKAVDPDFQRPNGDYNIWYIANMDGEYLNGFESWDAVEGALLEFYLFGPLHWLGMIDLADDAARLNAYGRAFCHDEAWPNPPEQNEKIIVGADGVLTASRRVPRMDRFQAMRFTSWIGAAGAGTPFTYKVSMEGVRQAAEQGINTGHIAAFLTRMMDADALPPTLARQLETWSESARQSVTVEAMTVLRTTAPETLDFILSQPGLRRYCAARLGEMAVAVRGDQLEALREALESYGLEVDLL